MRKRAWSRALELVTPMIMTDTPDKLAIRNFIRMNRIANDLPPFTWDHRLRVVGRFTEWKGSLYEAGNVVEAPTHGDRVSAAWLHHLLKVSRGEATEPACVGGCSFSGHVQDFYRITGDSTHAKDTVLMADSIRV